jgi:putative ABC transport system substrate-binding protein
MNRRAFISGMAGSLLAAPFAAEAQQPASPVRIGFMPLGSPSNTYDQSLVDAFREGLREAGVIENRHVILDVVWISSEPDTSQAVSDMVERGTKLLIPCGSSASVAAMRQTKTIPILFVSVGNPVGVGPVSYTQLTLPTILLV